MNRPATGTQDYAIFNRVVDHQLGVINDARLIAVDLSEHGSRIQFMKYTPRVPRLYLWESRSGLQPTHRTNPTRSTIRMAHP